MIVVGRDRGSRLGVECDVYAWCVCVCVCYVASSVAQSCTNYCLGRIFIALLYLP